MFWLMWSGDWWWSLSRSKASCSPNTDRGRAEQEWKANRRYLDGAQGLLPAWLRSATESGPQSKRSLKREERLGMGKEREVTRKF